MRSDAGRKPLQRNFLLAVGRGVRQNLISTRVVAATARLIVCIVALAILIAQPSLHPLPAAATVGFALGVACTLTHLFTNSARIDRVEEIIAALAGIAINGLGGERVTALSLLWLGAVTTGAVARARVDAVAAVLFAIALGLPVVLVGDVQIAYLGVSVTAAALLVTGRAFSWEQDQLLTLARWEARHDDLTGALSRHAFRKELGRAIDAASPDRPLSLLVIDLNRFGMVNKLYGHGAGDALLAQTAKRIAALSPEGALVARLGGDEFAVAAHGDAFDTAQQLLEDFAYGHTNGPTATASVGIASAPKDARDADALMRAGDIALRIAKRNAARPICIYAGESLTGDGTVGAETTLTRLITGEGINMVVQPIYDLRTGEAHAYEALARFSTQATSSPLHWLSLAEEFGQRDALECACLAASTELLRTLPAGARLSVNISGLILPDARALAILQGLGDLSALIIEITEDALVRNDDPALNAAIAVVRRRGAQLAVDDMGAGYAGLRQITAVHPDYLKLDRSMVAGLHNNPDRAALVRAMVDFAERVGARLVAEGVETQQELEMCTELGVHLVQGFLLARPDTPWPTVTGTAAELLPTAGTQRRGIRAA